MNTENSAAPEDSGTEKRGKQMKVGLALSGGGFRASIFHLGVIRRLEERGIMPDVAVISSVSGGSIIAAYYICEMERRLRARREDYRKRPIQTRVEIFEQIAEDFFKALDHNLRTRALVFPPFYHPLLFVKSLWPGCSRSDLLRKEYDKWFYFDNTLDQLPAVIAGDANEQTADQDAEVQGDETFVNLAGPKLVINATSLHTGQRVTFSRVPVEGVTEVEKPNENGIRLSQAVGASSCVPGAMPPTPILGDLLVDGGVSDNQGIESLYEEECDILLVSDACGQFEAQNKVSTRALGVVARTTSVFQFEIRRKILDGLIAAKELSARKPKASAAQAPRCEQFAFLHLFLNLKDREQERREPIPRVPSEYIPGLGRIRTDLDQFSYIEREALMYHGYTLIEAQIKKYCPYFEGQEDPDREGMIEADVLAQGKKYAAENAAPMLVPPLFREQSVQDGGDAAKEIRKRRSRIKKELVTGALPSLVYRAFWRFCAPVVLGVLVAVAIYGALMTSMLHFFGKQMALCLGSFIEDWYYCTVPCWLEGILSYVPWPFNFGDVAVILVLGLLAYVVAFGFYFVMQRVIACLNGAAYGELTEGASPSAKWTE